MTTDDIRKQLQEAEGAAPGAYVSQYQPTIDKIIKEAQNRKFSYDFNADPLYQQYREQYSNQGKQAGMNAAANAAINTGGFSNSYATTASSMANQSYMDKLNQMIPQLYEAAVGRFESDTQNLQNRFDMVQSQEQNAYNQYRGQVEDYQTNRDYYYNMYNNSVQNDQWQKQFDYTKGRDKVADEQWLKQFNENVRQFGLNYALAKG